MGGALVVTSHLDGVTSAMILVESFAFIKIIIALAVGLVERVVETHKVALLFGYIFTIFLVTPIIATAIIKIVVALAVRFRNEKSDSESCNGFQVHGLLMVLYPRSVVNQ